MVVRSSAFGSLAFDRDAIVRAALCAYVEGILAPLDPLGRLPFASPEPGWMGDVTHGAFFNGDGCGDYHVVAWNEAGVVALGYELGWGPTEQLGLSVEAVTGGPDDVRAALPGLPPELEPALAIAGGLLLLGPAHGEKLAGAGFWLHGDRVAGTLFDAPTSPGAGRLAAWGALQGGWLVACGDPVTAARPREPIDRLVDALVDRALAGPTELTTDELETLLPCAPAPPTDGGLGPELATWLDYAQTNLRKVGITWPGSP